LTIYPQDLHLHLHIYLVTLMWLLPNK